MITKKESRSSRWLGPDGSTGTSFLFTLAWRLLSTNESVFTVRRGFFFEPHTARMKESLHKLGTSC